MKVFHGKYEKHYGGIFGKKFIYQTQPIYGCGEVTSWEWINDKKGEIAVKLKYLSSDGTIARNMPVVFTGIKKQRDETFKEKMFGKKAAPILPFEIGDMIVFEGEEKTYDLNYARDHGLEHTIRTANKVIVMNQLKAMAKDDAVKFVNEMLDDEKFEKIYLEQIEKRQEINKDEKI